MQTGDLSSLAIATAGRIQSFAVNDDRVPEAASLATDLEDMANGIDCERPKEHPSQCGGFGAVLQLRVRSRAPGHRRDSGATHEVPAVEIALARAIRGSIETCLGDYELGRRHLRESVEQARALSPVVYAHVLFFSGAMVALGMSQADDLVDDVHEALRRAESFGDIGGIIAAQYSYGITLLRAEVGSPDEALDVLERVRTGVEKHRMFTFAAATIDAVLEIDAARKGKLDEAINVLRASFALYMGSGSRVFVDLRVRPWSGFSSNADLPTISPKRTESWTSGRPSGPHSRTGPLVAEVTRVVGQGRRQFGLLHRVGQPVPRAVRKARRPRPTPRGAANGERDHVMAMILAYTSPALGHLLPISALLAELSRRGHTVHVRTLSTGVEIGQRFGFVADATDPRIEEIEQDDWKATNPVAALKRSVAVITRRAAHEVSDLADAVTRVRPDALLVDVNCWGALSMAEAGPIPWACFSPYTPPLRSRGVPPFGLGLKPLSGLLGRMRDAAVRIAVVGGLEKVMLPPINTIRAKVNVGPVASMDDSCAGRPCYSSRAASHFSTHKPIGAMRCR